MVPFTIPEEADVNNETYIAVFIAILVYVFTRKRHPNFFDWDRVIIKFVNSEGTLYYIIVYTHPAYALSESVIDLGNRLICRYEDLCHDIAKNHATNLMIENVHEIDKALKNIADSLIKKLMECHWPNKPPDGSSISIFVEYNLKKPI